ncbi:MAG: AraC family transcriptional regulator ligand-binding domain-containing protein [Polyangiales bacterium]
MLPQLASSTVSRQVLRALVEGVEERGTPRAPFLLELGLREADLDGAGARVPLPEMIAYCERALAATRDPALGLHWGAGLSERAFGPVSHLVAHTGTLRRGFELIAQFQTLFCDERTYAVLEHADTMSIRMVGLELRAPSVEVFMAEMLLSSMLTMVRSFHALALPVCVRFAHARPAHHAEYQRVFGPDVCFEQTETELVFARTLLDEPSPHGDQDMHNALKTVAEQRLVRLTRSAPQSVRLRDYLRRHFAERPNMATASRALGQSPRSLRRHLTDEGTSYRAVEYAALESVGKRLLCDQGLSIQETAHEMGFSDAATFHRAFRTWTGLTPSSYRARTLSASPSPGSARPPRGSAS